MFPPIFPRFPQSFLRFSSIFPAPRLQQLRQAQALQIQRHALHVVAWNHGGSWEKHRKMVMFIGFFTIYQYVHQYVLVTMEKRW